MQNDFHTMRSAADPLTARTAAWIVILTLASIAFSLALACATPFAALGALAGARMNRREGMALVAASWLANQFVGYFVLAYPRTLASFAWGAAIGVAALLATLGAREAARAVRPPMLSKLVAFVAAFIVYEGVLLAATTVLPSSAAAFSVSVVARIIAVNAGAFVSLLAIHRLAMASGLQGRTTPSRAALSHG
jgi:hypothetical protein